MGFGCWVDGTGGTSWVDFRASCVDGTAICDTVGICGWLDGAVAGICGTWLDFRASCVDGTAAICGTCWVDFRASWVVGTAGICGTGTVDFWTSCVDGVAGICGTCRVDFWASWVDGAAGICGSWLDFWASWFGICGTWLDSGLPAVSSGLLLRSPTEVHHCCFGLGLGSGLPHSPSHHRIFWPWRAKLRGPPFGAAAALPGWPLHEGA